jgi:DNA-directed RNA polymerase specialized sigma24 family protein
MLQSIVVGLDPDNRDADLASTRTERRQVQKLAARLPEPNRTIFLYRQAGMTPREISVATTLEMNFVCRALAKIYSDLRVKLIA